MNVDRVFRKSVLPVVVLMCALMSTSQIGLTRQLDDLVLLRNQPDGVLFQRLAQGNGPAFRFHTDRLSLDRIRIACGQASGEIQGMEQITFVEYGSVEVRDWESMDLVETLEAGDWYGPTETETSFFLISPMGHQASVLHASLSGNGTVGDETPPITLDGPYCGSGASSSTLAEAADVEILALTEDIENTSLATNQIYIGLITVEPGQSIGESGEGVSSTGSGLIVVQSGSFGDGSVNLPGPDHQIATGEFGILKAGQRSALANYGPIPTVALVVGVVPVDSPLFAEK